MSLSCPAGSSEPANAARHGTGIGDWFPASHLLMGAGPVNLHPRVLRALGLPMIGQYDPMMREWMAQTAQLWRSVFRSQHAATAVVDGSARAAIEAVLTGLLRPGDRVLVPVFGRFGGLLEEIAFRAGSEVHTIHAAWGSVFSPEQVIGAIDRTHPRVVAVVHGESSTTMCQPLTDIGAACAERGILLFTDVTASLGGNPFSMDDWHVDAACTGLQKCLGGPPGAAPFALSAAALAAVRARRRTESGIRSPDEVPSPCPAPSNYLDVDQILEYWGPRGLNHHTQGTTLLYAAREAGTLITEAGIDATVEAHRLHGQAVAVGLSALGLRLYGDQQHRLNNAVGFWVPDAIPARLLRQALIDDFGVEIGESPGPLRESVLRIGAMGYNARRDTVLITLAALGSTLRSFGHPHAADAGTSAAREFYQDQNVRTDRR